MDDNLFLQPLLIMIKYCNIEKRKRGYIMLHRLADRKAFRLMFIVAVFFQTLNLRFLQVEYTPLIYVVIVWGGYILLHDLFCKELWYRGNHVLQLCGYLLCAIFATWMNVAYTSTSSWILVILQGLIFLLVFSQPKSRTLMQMKEEIRQVGSLVSILCFLASAISLVMFFFNINLASNGTEIGIVNGRLFGIYFNSNPAAFLACMSIVFSMLAIRNHYKLKAFFYVNIVVQVLYVILSGCRSAILILAALVVVMLYYTLFKRKSYTIIQQVFITMLTVMLVGVGSYTIKQTLYLVPQLQGAVIQNERFHVEELVEVATLIKENPIANRRTIINLLDVISSGRVQLYTDAMKMWLDYPLTGIGYHNFHEMGSVMFPTHSVMQEKQVVHAHNFLLESLVTTGLFGFLFFFLFTFKSFTTMLEVLRKYTRTSSYLIVLLLSFIVWIEVLGGMLDYGIFYVYSLSSLLFWLVLGYLFWFNERAQLYLVVNQDAYEFVSYRLDRVKYSRKEGVDFTRAALHIVEEELIDFRLHMHLAVVLFMEQDTSNYFSYEGVFQLRRAYANEEDIAQLRQRMALELYDIIKHDIEVLASDEAWKLTLPYGTNDLF